MILKHHYIVPLVLPSLMLQEPALQTGNFFRFYPAGDFKLNNFSGVFLLEIFKLNIFSGVLLSGLSIQEMYSN